MDRDETSRRIRAARALAAPTPDELAARKRPVVGITTRELAARIDMKRLGYKTLGNMERGDAPALRPALSEIAKACGLPYEFFTADLATLGERADVDERFAQVERNLREQIDAVRRELAAIQPADDEVPQPPGELGRRIEEPQTTAEHPPQDKTRPAADRGRSNGG